MKSRYMKPVAIFLVIMMLFTLVPVGAVFATEEAEPVTIPLHAMVIEGTTPEELDEGEMLYDYEILSLTDFTEEITLNSNMVDDYITVDGEIYEFAGFVWYEPDGEEVKPVFSETCTITAAPEDTESDAWWEWYTPISDGIYVAYIVHKHNYGDYTFDDSTGHYRFCTAANCPDENKGKQIEDHTGNVNTVEGCSFCRYSSVPLTVTVSPSYLIGGGTLTATTNKYAHNVNFGASYKFTRSSENPNVWTYNVPNGSGWTPVYANAGTETVQSERFYFASEFTLRSNLETLSGGGTVELNTSVPAQSITCNDKSITIEPKNDKGNWWAVTLPNKTATYIFTATVDDYTANCSVNVKHHRAGGSTYVEPKKTELVYEDKDSGRNTGWVYFEPNGDTELPKDAELVVEPHKPGLEDLDFLLLPDANTEYVDLDDERISMNDKFSHTYGGVTYKMGEYIIIDGQVYFICGFGLPSDELHLISTDNKRMYTLELMSGNLVVDSRAEIPFDVPTNKRVSINGVTYDVECIFNTSGADYDGRVQWMLYYGGEPVGTYFPSQSRAVFYEGYDPATLNAKQDENELGTIIPGADSRSGLEKGKTYEAYVIGAQDVTVVDKDKNLFSVYTLETAEQKAARDEVNRLKADMDAKRAALDQIDNNAPGHMEAWAAWDEAETAYEEALKELEKLTAAKVTQAFDIPDAFVGRKDVQYVAVHTTESGAEFGEVTVSRDGRTLEAVYYVNSLSPFAVYAFVEQTDRIVMQIDNKTILANGRTIVNDVAPVIVDNRTMVPIRVITETLGGTAGWNAETRVVTLSIDGKTLSMTVGKTIDGFDTAPVILNGRTYVPVRYVAEAAGAKVQWEANTRQIVIEK